MRSDEARGCHSRYALLTDTGPSCSHTGIILSGSPYSVYDDGAPRVDPDVFTAGVPVLGICYGLQEIAWNHGGKVDPHDHREYGKATVTVVKTGDKHLDALFGNAEGEVPVCACSFAPFRTFLRATWLADSHFALLPQTRLSSIGLDVPRRPTFKAARRLRSGSAHTDCSLRSYCPQNQAHLRNPVPPRGDSLPARKGNLRGICGHLRLQD